LIDLRQYVCNAKDVAHINDDSPTATRTTSRQHQLDTRKIDDE